MVEIRRACRNDLHAQSETGAAIPDEWRVTSLCKHRARPITAAHCRAQAAFKPTSHFEKCCYSMPAATSQAASVERVALYHFATKSWQDFSVKMQRGSGMSKSAKTAEYFNDLARCGDSFQRCACCKCLVRCSAVQLGQRAVTLFRCEEQ